MPVPNPATLDDAQAALLEILVAVVEAESTSLAGYMIDDVYDGGRSRHERLVRSSGTSSPDPLNPPEEGRTDGHHHQADPMPVPGL